MSLILNNSNPKKIEISCHHTGKSIFFGDYEIPIDEFLLSVAYVLDNVDLHENDIRLKFIHMIKKCKIEKGWNYNFDKKSKRINVDYKYLFQVENIK